MPPATRNATGAVKPGPTHAQALVGLEDDDDDYEYVSGEEDEDPNAFQTKDKLPPAGVKKFTVKALVDLLETPWLDLDAEYQRDVVWSQLGMMGLINSLMEDYYIPPLIFNIQIVTDAQGEKHFKRICVDGKQRLSSIHAFVKGFIPVEDRHRKKWYFHEARDESGERIRKQASRLLPENIKQDFLAKSLVCTEFRDLTSEQEEELFARVQKGVALNPAEKLRATTGPWQALAREFEVKYSRVLRLAKSDRSASFASTLKMFAQVLECQTPSGQDGKPMQRIGAPSIKNFCEKQRSLCTPESRSHLQEVFAIFDRLVYKSPRTFGNNNYRVAKAFSPSELIAVAVLISQYMDTRNDDMLIGDIDHMRASLRAALPDLRLDSTTWKSCWMYIEDLESYRGRADGSMIRNSQFEGSGRRTNAAIASGSQDVSQLKQETPAPQRSSRPTSHVPSAISTSTSSRASPNSSHTPEQSGAGLRVDGNTPALQANMPDRRKLTQPRLSSDGLGQTSAPDTAFDPSVVSTPRTRKRRQSDTEEETSRQVLEAIERRQQRKRELGQSRQQ